MDEAITILQGEHFSLFLFIFVVVQCAQRIYSKLNFMQAPKCHKFSCIVFNVAPTLKIHVLSTMLDGCNIAIEVMN